MSTITQPTPLHHPHVHNTRPSAPTARIVSTRSSIHTSCCNPSQHAAACQLPSRLVGLVRLCGLACYLRHLDVRVHAKRCRADNVAHSLQGRHLLRKQQHGSQDHHGILQQQQQQQRVSATQLPCKQGLTAWLGASCKLLGAELSCES